MASPSPSTFGQRAGHAFRRLLVTLLVVALAGVVWVLLARDNARTYSAKVEAGRLTVLKGRLLPWGAAPYHPPDTALAEVYAPVDLGGANVTAPEPDRFEDRDELDRALFRILEQAARPKLLSEDTQVVASGMALLHRMDKLQGTTEEQRRTLRALELDVAYDQARIRFEDARRAVAEGLSELRIAADSPTRRARAAHAMLVKVEPAASALEDVLRQVVTTLADTPPSSTTPPAVVVPAAADGGVP